MPLNDTKLRKIHGKPYDGPAELPDGGGLSARISPKGRITFQYRYRFNHKPLRLKLGNYGSMSIKDAREAMQECKAWLAEGKDPAIQRIMKKEKVTGAATINDIVTEWLNSPAAMVLVKYEYWQRMLALHVTDKYGRLTVNDMDPTDWEKIFRGISDGGSPVQAGSVLVKMKQIVRYALRRKRVLSNSIMLIELNDVGKRPEDGERHLDDHEVGLFWRAVDETKMSLQNKIFIRLVLLTGCRGIELRLAKKADFDLDRRVWHIRKEISKTRKRFIRGLSVEAVNLLRLAFSLYGDMEVVFPPAKLHKDRPMAAGVLISMAEQVGELMGGDTWTMHDLRRTCKTQMAKLGVAPHVSEKILGHKLTGMLAVYDQHDYVEEQQKAADLWAGHVQACASAINPRSLQN
ncbi:tyrosine-type recombinase/integrase [Leminorella grimontii]|uniref:tyrosine-type recombinase/integrase n=1 Tax=Leminorella grimontii TaxID=82981 RepID=UPI0032209951